MRFFFNQRFFGSIIFIGIIIIMIQSCQPLDLKRLMDARTDEIEVVGTNVVAHGTILDIGESQIISYGHCWSKDPLPSIDDFHTDLGMKTEPGDFKSNLNNLVPGITQYVRSYVFDGENYEYGDAVSFQITAADINFNTLEFKQLDIGKITIMSKANGIGSFRFANHGHCWSQNDPPTIHDDSTAFGTFQTDTSFTSTINDLTLGQYYIRGYLEVENTIIYTNTIAYASEITVETGIISLNPDNSIIAHGKINSLGAKPISDYGYCWSTITSSPTLNNEHNTLGSISSLGSYSSTIKDLVSGREYFIRAYATDGSKVYYGQIKNFVAN